MTQYERTRHSRKLNLAVGMVPVTLMIPTAKEQHYKNSAALDRAEHMQTMIDKGDKLYIRLLAKKRSPWAHTAKNLHALEQLEFEREAARETLNAYRAIEDELEVLDYDEMSQDVIDKLRAQKVAHGHLLQYFAGLTNE